MARIIKELNDKFYTNPNVSKSILDKLDISIYDLVIEPSAGNGSFYEQINHHNKIGLDILPEADNIICCNWFDFKLDKLYNNILVIGNPPFGKQGSLALKFINHCDSFNAQTIVFILPKSFKKDSMKNKINLNYHLVEEYDIENNSFLLNNIVYDVPSIVQVWSRGEYPRKKKEMTTTTDLFTFVKKEDNPDFSVRRVGFYAGYLYENYEEKSTESHYFIKNGNILSLDRLIEVIKSLEWEHNNTAGARSISKVELIEKIKSSL